MNIIPVAAVFVGLGAQAILIAISAIYQSINQPFMLKKEHPGLLLAGCIVIILFIPVLKYRNIFVADTPSHWDRWQMAQEIDKYAAPGSKLVVVGEYTRHVGGYDLSPVLYYYTGLQGWTLTSDKWNLDYVENLRQKGATLFVALPTYSDPNSFINVPEDPRTDFIQAVKSKYTVLFENQDQLILDLR